MSSTSTSASGLSLGPVDTSPLDYSNDGTGMIIVSSILIALSTIFVALRFWSKRLSGAGWQFDDWLVLCALLVHHCFMAAAFVMILKGGLGRDIRLVAVEDPESMMFLYKFLFIAAVNYGFSSSLVKLSVLAFYWNLFPTRVVRIGCSTLGIMCILWTVSIQITNSLLCRPLQAFWHLEMRALPGTTCIDTILFTLGNSIVNCVIDFGTITLPVREVLKLQMSVRRRVGICAIFLLGGLAFISSVIRTVTTGIMVEEGTVNFTNQFVVPGEATITEIYVAIIAACLPTLMPLYRKLRYGAAQVHMGKVAEMSARNPKGGNQPAVVESGIENIRTRPVFGTRPLELLLQVF